MTRTTPQFASSSVVDAQRRDQRYVWHSWSPIHPAEHHLIMTHGDGYHVWDVTGRRYLDGMSSSMNGTLGYRHPALLAAVTDQLGALPHFDLVSGGHEPVGRLAEAIADLMPGELERTFFVNSGSEAAEVAVRIATDYWHNVGAPHRRRIVTFEVGYHGCTLLARSLSGLPATAHGLTAPTPVTRVPLPLPARELRGPGGRSALLEAFRTALDAGNGPGDVLAVVVEPFLNVGGGIVLPPGFLADLERLCRTAGTLLIVDEVFTGFGRTGRMFGFEHDGVVPDLVMTSKGLGGGYLPLGAVTTTTAVYESFAADPIFGGIRYGHTTSGHAAACAVALAGIKVLLEDNLIESAARHGAVLVDALTAMAPPWIQDVRGLGLVTVMEAGSMEAAAALVDAARQRGLLLRLHETAAMLLPPLIIDDDGIRAISDVLGAVFAASPN